MPSRREIPAKTTQKAARKRSIAPKQEELVVPKVRRAIIDDPQIGSLTPEEFEAIGRAALGGHGWQRRFIAGTGLAQSTITRYLRGVFPVPRYVATILELVQTLRNAGLPLPQAFLDRNHDSQE